LRREQKQPEERRGSVAISSRVIATDHLVNEDILPKAVPYTVAFVKEQLEHHYPFI